VSNAHRKHSTSTGEPPEVLSLDFALKALALSSIPQSLFLRSQVLVLALRPEALVLRPQFWTCSWDLSPWPWPWEC